MRESRVRKKVKIAINLLYSRRQIAPSPSQASYVFPTPKTTTEARSPQITKTTPNQALRYSRQVIFFPLFNLSHSYSLFFSSFSTIPRRFSTQSPKTNSPRPSSRRPRCNEKRRPHTSPTLRLRARAGPVRCVLIVHFSIALGTRGRIANARQRRSSPRSPTQTFLSLCAT